MTKIEVMEDVLEQLKIPMSELDCVSDIKVLNGTTLTSQILLIR